MSKEASLANLFVANILFAVNESDLIALFSEYGTVASAQVIPDRDTGKSRGFAFVEMSTEAEAARAMEALNGADFRGRPLQIEIAKPKPPRTSDRRR